MAEYEIKAEGIVSSAAAAGGGDTDRETPAAVQFFDNARTRMRTEMTWEEYAAIDAVNWSTLKHVRRSPRHYIHGVKVPTEDTAPLRMGRAAHTAILEPDRLAIDYAVWTGDRRAGKAWDEFCAENGDRTIVKSDEYADALGMRAAVLEHPVAAKLMEQGKPEVVLTWTDALTDLPCKARLDWVTWALVDLKTTSNIDSRIFGSLAARMGYHCQCAFYRQGLLANGIECPAVKIIAVESSAPYDVAVFSLSDADLEMGEAEVMECLSKVSAGRFSGEWPGRYEEEVPLSLPAWMFNDDESGSLGLLMGGEDAA